MVALCLKSTSAWVSRELEAEVRVLDSARLTVPICPVGTGMNSTAAPQHRELPEHTLALSAHEILKQPRLSWERAGHTYLKGELS